jgi:membrane protease YdiL (CAAX protease family)
MLGGIGFTYFTQTAGNWHDYWARVFDVSRIPARWYAIIFLFAPVLFTIAVLLDLASGGSDAAAQVGKTFASFQSAPSTIVPFLLVTLINGPIPEELGWRGYVLDQLQARWSALAASIILGVVWTIWHLPLFFFAGMKHDVGVQSLWFWLFVLQTIPVTIIFTWIFNNTSRSTLGAILFHFMANLTAELASKTERTNLYATVLWILAAIAVVWFRGAGPCRRATDGDSAEPAQARLVRPQGEKS